MNFKLTLTSVQMRVGGLSHYENWYNLPSDAMSEAMEVERCHFYLKAKIVLELTADQVKMLNLAKHFEQSYRAGKSFYLSDRMSSDLLKIISEFWDEDSLAVDGNHIELNAVITDTDTANAVLKLVG